MSKIWRRLIATAARVKTAIPSTSAHLLFLGGLVSIVIGSALIYRPLGYIVGGLFGIWVSLIISAESK